MDAIITLSQLYPAVFYSLVFFVSLMVGSFLNVVIYRLPIMMERSWQQEYESYFSDGASGGENEGATISASADDKPPLTTDTFNLVKPDSTCPSCGHKIRAWENIPVISYLFLKGKCAKCKVGISIRYPLVELFTAIACTFAAYQFGVTSQALWVVIFTYVLVALLFIDLDKMLLPDQLTLPLLWLGLLLSTQNIFVGTTDAIIGAAAWLFKLMVCLLAI